MRRSRVWPYLSKNEKKKTCYISTASDLRHSDFILPTFIHSTITLSIPTKTKQPLEKKKNTFEKLDFLVFIFYSTIFLYSKEEDTHKKIHEHRRCPD